MQLIHEYREKISVFESKIQEKEDISPQLLKEIDYLEKIIKKRARYDNPVDEDVVKVYLEFRNRFMKQVARIGRKSFINSLKALLYYTCIISDNFFYVERLKSSLFDIPKKSFDSYCTKVLKCTDNDYMKIVKETIGYFPIKQNDFNRMMQRVDIANKIEIDKILKYLVENFGIDWNLLKIVQVKDQIRPYWYEDCEKKKYVIVVTLTETVTSCIELLHEVGHIVEYDILKRKGEHINDRLIDETCAILFELVAIKLLKTQKEFEVAKLYEILTMRRNILFFFFTRDFFSRKYRANVQLYREKCRTILGFQSDGYSCFQNLEYFEAYTKYIIGTEIAARMYMEKEEVYGEKWFLEKECIDAFKSDVERYHKMERNVFLDKFFYNREDCLFIKMIEKNTNSKNSSSK